VGTSAGGDGSSDHDNENGHDHDHASDHDDHSMTNMLMLERSGRYYKVLE
jgi:hypothetical protein